MLSFIQHTRQPEFGYGSLRCILLSFRCRMDIMIRKIYALLLRKYGSQESLRKLLYIATAAVVMYWAGFGIVSYWRNSLTLVAAENHAYLVELNGQLQNLAKPNQLKIGVTSGNADEIIHEYQAVLKTISPPKLSGGSFISHGWFSYKITELNNTTSPELSQMAAQLRETTSILIATKKILQYNPQIDLVPIATGQEPDPTERVNRTADGIQTTVDDLSKINHANAKRISDIVKPLVAQARSITAANASEWYIAVESVQQSIVTIIHDDFTKQLASNTQMLISFYQKYLELK